MTKHVLKNPHNPLQPPKMRGETKGQNKTSMITKNLKERTSLLDHVQVRKGEEKLVKKGGQMPGGSMCAEQCPARSLTCQSRSGQIVSIQVFPYSSPSYTGDKEQKPQDKHQDNCIMNFRLNNRIFFRRTQQKVPVSSKLVPPCHSDQAYYISSFQRRFSVLLLVFSIIDFYFF